MAATQLKNETIEYRIEGFALHIGWILLDRTPDDIYAKLFLKDWRKAQQGMKFRLKKVTTITTEEIVEED